MTPGDASVGVVVPAAGLGSRMGGTRKPFLELAGQPVLAWTLQPFLDHPAVASVIVALAPDEAERPPTWITDLGPRVRVVAGGDTRTHSVAFGLAALPDAVSIVLIHDGARPLVRTEWIDACIACAESGEGAVVGHPVVDSLKRASPTGRIDRTEPRAGLWQVQTPQAFPRTVLEQAYRSALETGEGGTDDAELVERLGFPIRLVDGDRDNVKITYPPDLLFAAAVLEDRRANRRLRGPSGGPSGGPSDGGLAGPADRGEAGPADPSTQSQAGSADASEASS